MTPTQRFRQRLAETITDRLSDELHDILCDELDTEDEVHAVHSEVEWDLRRWVREAVERHVTVGDGDDGAAP